MRARFIAASLALLGVVSGCSALGLSDDLDRAPCDACEELNTLEPPPACMSWQCTTPDDPMNGICALDLIDEDGDDAPSMECATPERPADCDDADPANGPETSEGCDLADNDCDGSIDEDALTIASAVLVEANVSALSFSGTSGEVVAAYRNADGLEVARLGLDGTDAPASTLGGAATAGQPIQTAVAPLGAGWAVAYSAGSGCSRVVLGVWDGSGETLIAEEGHAAVGIGKTAGACPDDTSEVGSPAVAATSEDQALTAFLSQRASRECGDPAADVGLVVSQRNGGAFSESSVVATVAGRSIDAAPPSLVAVSRSFGYLLAFADDGGIGVHRVSVDGETLLIRVDELYREECSGPCGDASLTVAGDEVGLAFRLGECDGDATAQLRVLALDEGAETLSASGPLRVGESAVGLRRPVAARRTNPEEWVLAWVVTLGSPRSVDATRFDPEGMPVGLPLSLLRSEMAFPEAMALRSGEGAFGLRAFTFDGGEDAIVRSAAQCMLAE